MQSNKNYFHENGLPENVSLCFGTTGFENLMEPLQSVLSKCFFSKHLNVFLSTDVQPLFNDKYKTHLIKNIFLGLLQIQSPKIVMAR